MGELEDLRAFRRTVESSAGWRIVSRYHSLLYRLAPQGTSRRRLYGFVRRVAADTLHVFRPHDRRLRAERKGPIELPATTSPVATVLIPAYANAAATLDCLRSIAKAETKISYEVIVIDDSSPKDLRPALSRVKHLRVLRNPENLGFLRTCNVGAREAHGSYIVLLNNDTLVHDKWLDALVKTADADTAIGVVGAKLVYPDGRLQEAGAITWCDGAGLNYGRFDNPDAFQYCFSRDVDYCSGAALLVRRELWEKLGGFDDRFSPAYYEDTDLAFSARQSGYRVVYQPRAVVTHVEGLSHGSDETAGVKTFQRVNQEIFRRKWQDLLEKEHSASSTPTLWRARDRRRGNHVLIIDHEVPTPDRDSGSVRMFQLLRLLRELGFVVHFLPDNLQRHEPYTSALQDLGVEVVYGSVDIAAYVAGLSEDLVFAWVCRPTVAWRYLLLLRERAPGVPLFYDMIDAHGLREERRAALEESPMLAKVATAARELELALIRSCDATIAVSEEEATWVREQAPEAKRVEILPNIHEAIPGDFEPTGRECLLFVGGYRHPPNVDAAVTLVTELLPEIRGVLPRVPLILAGSNPTVEVNGLAGPEVLVPGWVEDITPLYARARVVVAPLRYGAGVKGKIGEAMLHGVPVVTTPIGAEGLGIASGEHLIVANDRSDFVAAVVTLYTDDELWLRMSSAARELVEERFGLDASRRRISEVLTSLGIPIPSGAHFAV